MWNSLAVPVMLAAHWATTSVLYLFSIYSISVPGIFYLCDTNVSLNLNWGNVQCFKLYITLYTVYIKLQIQITLHWYITDNITDNYWTQYKNSLPSFVSVNNCFVFSYVYEILIFQDFWNWFLSNNFDLRLTATPLELESCCV